MPQFLGQVGPCLAESDTGNRCPIVAWLFGPHRGCGSECKEQEMEEGGPPTLHRITVRMVRLRCSFWKREMREQMGDPVEDGKEHSVTGTTTKESAFLIF